MRVIALFFFLGTWMVQFFPTIPSFLSSSALSFSLLIATLFFGSLTLSFKESNKSRLVQLLVILGSLFAGLGAATLVASIQLEKRLAQEWEGKELVLQGKIIDIPEIRGDGSRFRLNISNAYLVDKPNEKIEQKGIIRLGWYQNRQEIHAGETWQLKVRLKQPSGFMNAGGFDYEKWLFTERIVATGYVRKSKTNENIRLQKSSWWSINRLRETIHQTIQTTVEDKASAAVLSALVVAVRTKLDDKQWNQLQQTGTSHLVAISGLHIAVVAGFAFFPIMLLWRLFPRLNEKIPVRVAGGIAGILFATLYAMLAGFTLPTQRALLMVVIGVLGLVSRRHYLASTILATALLAVLILDPLATMTISFWLSFLAVSLILIFLKRQLLKPNFQLIKLQLVLSLAMFPLTLFFFGTASLSSPLANLFAIPWVSFIVVPISLLALIMMPLSAYLSGALFSIAAKSVAWLFDGLRLVNELPFTNFSHSGIPHQYLVIAFLGLIFLLLPKGYPARWLGLIALLPALLFTTVPPKTGAFNYTLLDVGQGMASAVQTNSHTLIYDTGTKISDSFDIGKLVVNPYLASQGINKVDLMIVSHEDIDHRGGAQAIVDLYTVEQILTSDSTLDLGAANIKECKRGDHWQWDGVDFEILSPQLSDQDLNDNNRSCVLRVSNKYHSLLLTADIQRKTEKHLVAEQFAKLKSDVMTMPHHGSRTSSSLPFINAVSPKLVLIPAGYRNRFGHPKVDIVERYSDRGIRLLDTVNSGAITVQFQATDDAIRVDQFRQDNKGFWSRSIDN